MSNYEIVSKYRYSGGQFLFYNEDIDQYVPIGGAAVGNLSPLVLTAHTATETPLKVAAATGQSADLFDVYTPAGALAIQTQNNGNVLLGGGHSGSDINGNLFGASLSVPNIILNGANIIQSTPNGNIILQRTEGKITLTGVSTQINALPVQSLNVPAPNNNGLTSGTAWQNGYAYDVMLLVRVTLNPTSGAAATIVGGVGPTSTPATNTLLSVPANSPTGVIQTLTFVVPCTWYVLLTATNATIFGTNNPSNPI